MQKAIFSIIIETFNERNFLIFKLTILLHKMQVQKTKRWISGCHSAVLNLVFNFQFLAIKVEHFINF